MTRHDTRSSAFLRLVFALPLGCATMTWTAHAAPYDNFKDYCEHRASLTPAVAQTIQAILDNLYVTYNGPQSPVDWTCDDAAAKLAATRSLTLLDRSDSFFPG